MNATDYQTAAARTLIAEPDSQFTGNEQMLMWCALGLGGEAGEVLDHLKKAICHRHGLNVEKLGEELGDLMWYVAAICELAGISLDGVLTNNIAKLRARYPNGYSSADSQARVDTKPRSDTLPIGTRATCQACGQPIEWIDPYWRHYGMGDNQPRHPAFPVEYAL